MHEEEDEEGYEEPQRHHLEVLEGRPAGPAASAEHTQEGDEQGDLGKGKFILISAYFALEASSGLRTCITCFCIFLFKQAKEKKAMRRVHGRWFSEELLSACSDFHLRIGWFLMSSTHCENVTAGLFADFTLIMFSLPVPAF